jgi:hypothetical protein
MMLHQPDWNPTILKEAGVTEEMVAGLGKELADVNGIMKYSKNGH